MSSPVWAWSPKWIRLCFWLPQNHRNHHTFIEKSGCMAGSHNLVCPFFNEVDMRTTWWSDKGPCLAGQMESAENVVVAPIIRTIRTFSRQQKQKLRFQEEWRTRSQTNLLYGGREKRKAWNPNQKSWLDFGVWNLCSKVNWLAWNKGNVSLLTSSEHFTPLFQTC